MGHDIVFVSRCPRSVSVAASKKDGRMSSSNPDEQSSDVSPARVVLISSVMFVFISYWRVAAIILCDLASTAYYIGGIVEHSIGPAAPWFILAVMVFSYAVRSVYIESCSMYVRGGVYKIVKESLGRTLAKVAVSALLFDYVLTGPISSVSAGQYIMGLALESISHLSGMTVSPESRDWWKSVGSVVIACAITIYFYRLNIVGIHESSDKALKIMIATAIMGVTILGWSALTLVMEGPRNTVTFQPTFVPKENPATGQMESPLGFLEGTSFGDQLLQLDGASWLSAIGFLGVFLAFGHSVLAMSGEETLAQIYREVESPKLANFKRAAFIVFIVSLLLTGGISVLAVLLIPDSVRASQYSDNLIGGLAMNVYGPPLARLLLNAFVVGVGSLLLAGAVNTAIIGSNGVLNRVAEDGVIPEWMLKPHPKFGTTHRILTLIFGLQMCTILISRGNVLLLGEAYAFGVVWSFVFNCLAMLILRFKDPNRPRGFRVPLNLTIGGIELPIGLALIFLVLLISAVMNALTKEIATITGSCFTAVLFVLFTITDRNRSGKPETAEGEHVDQFNEIETETVTEKTLGLTHRYRKLVAVRSPDQMIALDKVLEESDPETTDIIAMKAHVRPVGGVSTEPVRLGQYERELINAVEHHAEVAGKTVIPILVSTNNPIHALLQTAMAIGVQEIIIGTSEKFTPDQQLNLVASGWKNLHPDTSQPLTVRIVGGNRDISLDLDGGSRIPKSLARESRSVAELRAAGIGVDRVLLLHDGSRRSSEVFRILLTMLDRSVTLDILPVGESTGDYLKNDVQEAARLERRSGSIQLESNGQFADSLIRAIRDGGIDVVVARQSLATFGSDGSGVKTSWVDDVEHQVRCQVFLAAEIT
jgi:amino acid transporter